MTMQQMVEYLEAVGFKATKKYIPARKLYDFHVSMDDNHLIRYFVYPTGVEEMTKGRLQKEFLDKICHDFTKEFGGNRGIRTAHCPFMNSCKFYPKGECGGCNYYTPYIHSDPVVNKKVEEFKKYVKYDMDSYAQLVSSLNEKGGIAMHYCDYSKFSISPSGSAIKDVIFNDPATIVYWTDGTKTVVKAGNEEFDPEKGLAMAIAKKALGNKGNYFETIKKWVKKYKRPEEPEIPELKLGKLTMAIDGTKITEAASKLAQDMIDAINEKHMKKKVIDK